MTSIFNTAVASINAMKVMIDQTINKINKSSNKNPEKRMSLENTMQDTNLNTAVKVKEIYDNYNNFIEEEKRKTSVQVKSEQTKVEQLLKLEDLFCEKSNIFNILTRNVYEEIKKDTIFDRKNKINDNIQDRLSDIIFALKDFGKKLKFLETEIKDSVISIIQQANYLIDKIRDINIDIHYFPISQLPNGVDSLIDKRDRLVDELNDLIGVRIVKSNDSYKLYLSNGLCIIDNNQKQNLIPLTSIADERYVSVGYFDTVDEKVKKIEYMIPTGSLGSLLKFRREELENAKNKVGQLTINFADSINSYHTLGYDMFGHPGRQVFKISDPEIVSSSTNHSSPAISSKWISTNNVQDSDYIIYFKNNSWRVTRLSDHSVIQPNIYQENNEISMTFDGIEFKLEGDNADGDIYMIKPYSKTLENLELLVNQNNFFEFSLADHENQTNRNNTQMMVEFNQGNSASHKEALDKEYQKFSKSIAYKCNLLEEALPFKKIMVEILHDKKISMSNDIEKDYQNLNYQQECYLASAKVLKTAESIFNEIVDCYS